MTSKYRIRGFNFIEVRSNLEILEQLVLVPSNPCAVYQITDDAGVTIGLLEDIHIPHTPNQKLLLDTPGLSHVEISAWVAGSIEFEGMGSNYIVYLRNLSQYQEIIAYLKVFFASAQKMQGDGGLIEAPTRVPGGVASIDRSNLITLINRVYERCVELDIDHFPTRTRALTLRLAELTDGELCLELRWVVDQLNVIEQTQAIHKQRVVLDKTTLDAATIAANLTVKHSIAHGISVFNFESANIKGK